MKYCAALILVSTLALAAYAQPVRVSALASGPGDRYRVYRALDPSGVGITIFSREAITADQEELLYRLRERARTLELLSIESVRVLLDGARAQVVVVPASYRYRDYDLTTFLPAGILFVYEDELEYDLRALIGHYVLRLQGPFQGDRALAETLVDAAENPAAYLRARSSEYLKERFSAIDQDITALRDADEAHTRDIESLESEVSTLSRVGGEALDDLSEVRQNASAMAGRLGSLDREVSSLREDLGEVEQTVAASRTDIARLERIYQSLSGEESEVESTRSELEAEFEQLKGRFGEHVADFDTLRGAVLVLNNRNRPVEQDALALLIELKNATPGLTQAEAADLLKEQGLGLRRREISLIFALFFGEFE